MVERLVIHAGAPKTATTFIQRGLHSNREVLAENGVYLPETGRLEFEPQAVCHHHLGWALLRPRSYRDGTRDWTGLARELERVDEPIVLLSSEVFSRVASTARGPEEVVEAARRICDDVTIVYFVRNQLSLLNSLYGQRVKSLRTRDTFEQHTRVHRGRKLLSYPSLLLPWHRSDAARLVAVPFTGDRGEDPLRTLMAAAGLPLDTDVELRHEVDDVNASLGPVGLEAARLLSCFLTGTYEDFDPEEPAAKKLYRLSSSRARANGWCDEPFWGWTESEAAETADFYKASNEEFARLVWDSEWPLEMPLDKPCTAAQLLELDPPTTEKVQRYVFGLTRRFATLRASALASGDGGPDTGADAGGSAGAGAGASGGAGAGAGEGPDDDADRSGGMDDDGDDA